MRNSRIILPSARSTGLSARVASGVTVVLAIAQVACSGSGSTTGGGGDAAATAKAGTNSAAAAGAVPTNFTLTAAQQARVHVVTAAPSTFQPVIEVTGTVEFNGDHSTSVLSPVSGPVTRLLVEPGRQVSKGAPLATVTSPDFASAVAAYRKAQTTTQNLQRIATQDEQLFKTDAIARRDVDQAQADASAAVADEQAALEQIRALGIDPASVSRGASGGQGGLAASAVIRAPISGTVVERMINPGQLLQAGTTPAFTIADLSTVWVMANVFETDLSAVHNGESATVTTDATSAPFSGTVDYVSAFVDSSTRATAVRLVAHNRKDLLKRGMYVRVAIASDRSRTGILLPAAAVLRDDENLPFVFVAVPTVKSTAADSQSVARDAPATSYARRRITLGAHVGDRYEVLSGLTAGDRVVTEGALFLQFAESQ